MSDDPFRFEMAKSSRVKCVTCDEVIEKGEVKYVVTQIYDNHPAQKSRHLKCVKAADIEAMQ